MIMSPRAQAPPPPKSPTRISMSMIRRMSTNSSRSASPTKSDSRSPKRELSRSPQKDPAPRPTSRTSKPTLSPHKPRMDPSGLANPPAQATTQPSSPAPAQLSHRKSKSTSQASPRQTYSSMILDDAAPMAPQSAKLPQTTPVLQQYRTPVMDQTPTTPMTAPPRISETHVTTLLNATSPEHSKQASHGKHTKSHSTGQSCPQNNQPAAYRPQPAASNTAARSSPHLPSQMSPIIPADLKRSGERRKSVDLKRSLDLRRKSNENRRLEPKKTPDMGRQSPEGFISPSLKRLNPINLIRKKTPEINISDVYSPDPDHSADYDAGIIYGTRKHEWGTNSSSEFLPKQEVLSPVIRDPLAIPDQPVESLRVVKKKSYIGLNILVPPESEKTGPASAAVSRSTTVEKSRLSGSSGTPQIIPSLSQESQESYSSKSCDTTATGNTSADGEGANLADSLSAFTKKLMSEDQGSGFGGMLEDDNASAFSFEDDDFGRNSSVRLHKKPERFCQQQVSDGDEYEDDCDYDYDGLDDEDGDDAHLYRGNAFLNDDASEDILPAHVEPLPPHPEDLRSLSESQQTQQQSLQPPFHTKTEPLDLSEESPQLSYAKKTHLTPPVRLSETQLAPPVQSPGNKVALQRRPQSSTSATNTPEIKRRSYRFPDSAEEEFSFETSFDNTVTEELYDDYDEEDSTALAYQEVEDALSEIESLTQSGCSSPLRSRYDRPSLGETLSGSPALRGVPGHARTVSGTQAAPEPLEYNTLPYPGQFGYENFDSYGFGGEHEYGDGEDDFDYDDLLDEANAVSETYYEDDDQVGSSGLSRGRIHRSHSNRKLPRRVMPVAEPLNNIVTSGDQTTTLFGHNTPSQNSSDDEGARKSQVTTPINQQGAFDPVSGLPMPFPHGYVELTPISERSYDSDMSPYRR